MDVRDIKVVVVEKVTHRQKAELLKAFRKSKGKRVKIIPVRGLINE